MQNLIRPLYGGVDKLRNMKILDGVSGALKPGRFTLLLGPPGSGKSMLMRALAGQLRTEKTVKVWAVGWLVAVCVEWRCRAWGARDAWPFVVVSLGWCSYSLQGGRYRQQNPYKSRLGALGILPRENAAQLGRRCASAGDL